MDCDDSSFQLSESLQHGAVRVHFLNLFRCLFHPFELDFTHDHSDKGLDFDHLESQGLGTRLLQSDFRRTFKEYAGGSASPQFSLNASLFQYVGRSDFLVFDLAYIRAKNDETRHKFIKWHSTSKPSFSHANRFQHARVTKLRTNEVCVHLLCGFRVIWLDTSNKVRIAGCEGVDQLVQGILSYGH